MIDGLAVLDHETVFAPGALMGPGAQGAGRCLTTEVLVGARLPVPVVELTEHCMRSVVHLAPNCALLTVRS